MCLQGCGGPSRKKHTKASKSKSKASASSPSVSCSSVTKSVLSEREAKALFGELAKKPHIPFDYPCDCCYARAHEMCRIMNKKGIKSKKAWIFDKDWGTAGMKPSLKPKDDKGKPVTFPNSAGNPKPVAWVYHVAPIVKVRKSDGTTEDRVLDPSISEKPLTKDQWRKIMGSPPGAYMEESDKDAFFQNKKRKIRAEDPSGAQTKADFKNHRKSRDRNKAALKKKKKAKAKKRKKRKRKPKKKGK